MNDEGRDTRSGEFPQRLWQLRTKRGASRMVLAELCGLSKNAVARYERGERVPDIRTARALADFFNVSLDELVGR